MAQTVFTADLLSSQPPYNFRELGSAVIYADARETPMRTPSALHGTDASAQVGYNQAYYMENVMPTARGYTSVAYQSTVPQHGADVPEYVLECRGAKGELTYIAVVGSKVLKWNSGSYWEDVPDVYVGDSFIPQVAVVRGTSYFFFGSNVVYQYDFGLNKLVPLNITAVDVGSIIGITSGGSQLVLYTSDLLFYSNVLNAADFLPSLATGAGSTAVLALKGTIVACLPFGQDFMIYTQYSAVHARYTGNLSFPFNYNEIPGSTGIISQNHVAYNTNTGSHIVYTNAGIQEVTAAGAAPIFPEIADGISKGIVPYLDTVSGQPTYTTRPALNVRLTFIANRYLCISLGDNPESLTFYECYVFDSSLRRWGRLRVTHTCIFEWAGTAAYEGIKTYQDLSDAYPLYEDTAGKMYKELGNLAAKYSALNKQKLAIMSHTGQVCLMTMTENGQGIGDNLGTDAAMPRLFVGRVKINRQGGVVLQWLRFNKMVAGLAVLHGHDYNGAHIRKVVNLSADKYHAGSYTARLACDSISVEMQGAFVLTDLVVAMSNGGTHQQYAALPKKFERLLLSDLYPIVGDVGTVWSSQLPEVTRVWEWPVGYEELSPALPSIIEGELLDVLREYSLEFQIGDGAVSTLPDNFEGTLETIVMHYIDQQHQVGDSAIGTLPNSFSGTITTVLIDHTQIYQTGDGAAAGLPSNFAGTLT